MRIARTGVSVEMVVTIALTLVPTWMLGEVLARSLGLPWPRNAPADKMQIAIPDAKLEVLQALASEWDFGASFNFEELSREEHAHNFWSICGAAKCRALFEAKTL